MAEIDRMLNDEDRIMLAIDSKGIPTYSAELSRALDIPYGRTRNKLKALVKDNKVEETDIKKFKFYNLSDEGRKDVEKILNSVKDREKVLKYYREVRTRASNFWKK